MPGADFPELNTLGDKDILEAHPKTILGSLGSSDLPLALSPFGIFCFQSLHLAKIQPEGGPFPTNALGRAAVKKTPPLYRPPASRKRKLPGNMEFATLIHSTKASPWILGAGSPKKERGGNKKTD